MTPQSAPTNLAPLFRRRSPLTGGIQLAPEPERMTLVPTLEPEFYRLVREWGYPPLDVQWTGRRPSIEDPPVLIGRVLDRDEPVPAVTR